MRSREIKLHTGGEGTHTYVCVVCGATFERFLPFPASLREMCLKYGYEHFGRGETVNLEEYGCPCCGASDRERLSALFLEEALAGVEPDFRLIHFAPEPALSRKIRGMLTTGQYRTADKDMAGVDDQVDIMDMKAYGKETFDAFICSHVLEHVESDVQALQELHRILRRGGWGILMAPIMKHIEATLEGPEIHSEADRWRYFGQWDHVRLYSKRGWLQRIQDAGFHVEQLGIQAFGPMIFRSCGITPSSILYVVSKT